MWMVWWRFECRISVSVTSDVVHLHDTSVSGIDGDVLAAAGHDVIVRHVLLLLHGDRRRRCVAVRKVLQLYSKKLAHYLEWKTYVPINFNGLAFINLSVSVFHWSWNGSHKSWFLSEAEFVMFNNGLAFWLKKTSRTCCPEFHPSSRIGRVLTCPTTDCEWLRRDGEHDGDHHYRSRVEAPRPRQARSASASWPLCHGCGHNCELPYYFLGGSMYCSLKSKKVIESLTN